jgi:hypothetical protein
MNVTVQQNAISHNKVKHLERRCDLSGKRLFGWIFISSLALVILMAWLMATPVRADCGSAQPSSCITCHAQEDPVDEKGEWHIIHASKDVCIKCHGGNGTTMEKDLAHEGMTTNPLNDIYTDCHSCHPDYDSRAQVFASTLGVTPGSCATPTPVPVLNTSNQPPNGGINMPSNMASSASPSQPILVISAMLSILAFFVLGLVWLERHHA